MLNQVNIFPITQRIMIGLYKIMLSVGMTIGICACTPNNNGPTNAPAVTFTGSEAEQNNECEAVAKLAPDQSSVRYVGNIWREEVDNDMQFLQLWNQLTAENAGKWGEVERVRDEMQWERLDAAVAFSQNNNIDYKFHTLVWGANQPQWLNNLSTELQIVEIEQWMTQIAQRFPNMQQIDVVNEPLHAPPAYIDALNQFGNTQATTTSWAWVINTFAKARTVFPNSELLLNDFNILKNNKNTNSYLEIITLLQANDLIDGIGLQGHFLEETSVENIRSNLNKLGSTGLPVYISEFDLNIADDQLQLTRVQEIFPLFYSSQYVKGITFWGFRENQIWQADSHLINADGSKRPAMKWLECYLTNAR